MVREKHLEVTYEDTASLVPYARNAKKHTGAQVEQIANSIREFGFNDPIGVWTNEDGESEIIEGHGRVLAAERLGMDKVPVIHLDGLTDAQRRAYTLAHNQLTMNTGWDNELLEGELDDLLDEYDMSDFGFMDVDEEGLADAIDRVAAISEPRKRKPKRAVCPKCGHEFEVWP